MDEERENGEVSANTDGERGEVLQKGCTEAWTDVVKDRIQVIVQIPLKMSVSVGNCEEKKKRESNVIVGRTVGTQAC